MQQTAPKAIQHIAIVGGGSAGWMTAATLAKVLPKEFCKVTLIESPQIKTVSVGEASIPQIQLFNRILEIDENEFLQRTKATFKLGIEFHNFAREGDCYFHPFGSYGTNMDALPFHHFWLKQSQTGNTLDIENYSLAALAARQNKFQRPTNSGNSPLSSINYAFHFDAKLYADFLQDYAVKRGVQHIEANVTNVSLKADNGFIDSLFLNDGQKITADLYIDCSGFKGLLIEQVLKTGFEDWSHYLPCDSAVALACKNTLGLTPYTQAIAHQSGWRWRIPLQHRVGNGLVYASEFMQHQQASKLLQEEIEGQALADINSLKWTTGMRNKSWNKNCIAIGLSAGFLEPMESTGLHLIQSAIAKLMTLFPTKEFAQCDIDSYNAQTRKEFVNIRDFLILHYKATEREDSEFWRYCKNMQVPDSLHEKLTMYQETGRIFRQDNELFNETSWLAVMHGQGIKANRYHPLVDRLEPSEISRRLQHIEDVIKRSVATMPDHSHFINQCFSNNFCDIQSG
ncbi:tryptophan halogenase [Catenovulum agarivorans DS-2]|uniref:Tryptophan halogenase n=1 Tax=Catenovulum agarivorans DS-2 TaxID=1328313 RepID=W7QA12_9ALTE|nr:tryptophan halogenase family protein [Catenovulum agarivorans]EWH08836.1 tryptophan halogenase [Catenovulum agarivorans DS-2]